MAELRELYTAAPLLCNLRQACPVSAPGATTQRQENPQEKSGLWHPRRHTVSHTTLTSRRTTPGLPASFFRDSALVRRGSPPLHLSRLLRSPGAAGDVRS